MKPGAEVSFNLHTGARGSGHERAEPAMATGGRLPRVTQVLALAIAIQEMVQRGEVADYADFARQRCVSRERISQVVQLNWLAPDIQVQILYLPPTVGGRYPISELSLRRIAEISSWTEQRAAWEKLKGEKKLLVFSETKRAASQ